MDTTLPNLQPDPGDWVDLTVGQPTLAGHKAAIQCLAPDGGFMRIVWGGAEPSSRNQGVRVSDGETATGISDHIWIRMTAGNSYTTPTVSCTLLTGCVAGKLVTDTAPPTLPPPLLVSVSRVQETVGEV